MFTEISNSIYTNLTCPSCGDVTSSLSCGHNGCQSCHGLEKCRICNSPLGLLETEHRAFIFQSFKKFLHTIKVKENIDQRGAVVENEETSMTVSEKVERPHEKTISTASVGIQNEDKSTMTENTPDQVAENGLLSALGISSDQHGNCANALLELVLKALAVINKYKLVNSEVPRNQFSNDFLDQTNVHTNVVNNDSTANEAISMITTGPLIEPRTTIQRKRFSDVEPTSIQPKNFRDSYCMKTSEDEKEELVTKECKENIPICSNLNLVQDCIKKQNDSLSKAVLKDIHPKRRHVFTELMRGNIAQCQSSDELEEEESSKTRLIPLEKMESEESDSDMFVQPTPDEITHPSCVLITGQVSPALVREFTSRFNVVVSSVCTRKVTHLIVNNFDAMLKEPTFKYIYALAVHCKLLHWTWMEKSIQADRLLPDKEFLCPEKCLPPNPKRQSCLFKNYFISFHGIFPDGDQPVASSVSDYVETDEFPYITWRIYLQSSKFNFVNRMLQDIMEDIGANLIPMEYLSQHNTYRKMILVYSDISIETTEELWKKYRTPIVKFDYVVKSIVCSELGLITPYVMKPITEADLINLGYPEDMVLCFVDFDDDD